MGLQGAAPALRQCQEEEPEVGWHCGGSEHKSVDRSEDKFKVKSKDKSDDKSEYISVDKSDDKSVDKPEDKSEDKSVDKSVDKPEDKSVDKSICAVMSGVRRSGQCSQGDVISTWLEQLFPHNRLQT